ncbi:MAG: T9SS type A sorting domain-containing protein [Ignavibacteriales bacterium]|nr:MAG: T9SS type A sorting domain-containing protein [Ignavibacteriales bacterium]
MKIILLIICQSLIAVSLAQQVNTEEIPTHYRRGIESPTGYQSYNQKYFGKNFEEEKRKLFPLNRINSGTGVWTELNPNVPRVDYIGVDFINPDTGWAVGELGALIKTTDGGNNWTVIATNTTTLLLKVHSYNGQIVIVTGYDGMILRSSDGGETFEQIVSGTTNDLWGIIMLNNTTGFICGLNQTLLKTTDAGISWHSVNTTLNQHYWAIDFFNEQFGMIACGGGKVLRTTDGGNSWTEHQAGDASALYAIDIIDSTHTAAAGANGKNIYSTDGGFTWLQNNRLQHDELNSIRFINADTGYTIGTYGGESWGIRKTTNRGVTWFSPPLPNLSEWELELLSGGTGYSVGSDLWINKTTGGYDNWDGLFMNRNFVDVYFTDEQNGYAPDGTWIGGPLYKTTDGGEHWFGLPNFPTGVFTSTLRCVVFTDSLTGFVGSAPCRIVKTTDAGNSWRIVNRTGLTDTIGLINKIFFINPTTGWAVTTRGGILKTTDAGENWFAQLEAGSFVTFNSIFFINPLYGWTANEAQWPFKTTNGGDTWIQQTGANIFATRDIYFLDSLNAYTIKILELYKTTNSGNNWFAQLNSQYVLRTFGWLTSSRGFIIGDGIYETTDSGNTWNEILELRNIGLRKLHSPINHIGYSVGYTGLVYRCIDTTIVPVDLSSFFAEINNNTITLEWSTATETNNQGFEILKSNDKQSWKTIVFVEGHGTTTETHSYYFTDKDILSEKVKYRLKQIDYDGTFTYSKIIEVNADLTSTEFVLHQNYPNPFNPTTKIKFTIPAVETRHASSPNAVHLKVFDILGNEIATLVNETKPAGTYEVEFNAEGLSSGVYFYRLRAGSFISTKKLLLLK